MNQQHIQAPLLCSCGSPAPCRTTNEHSPARMQQPCTYISGLEPASGRNRCFDALAAVQRCHISGNGPPQVQHTWPQAGDSALRRGLWAANQPPSRMRLESSESAALQNADPLQLRLQRALRAGNLARCGQQRKGCRSHCSGCCSQIRFRSWVSHVETTRPGD